MKKRKSQDAVSIPKNYLIFGVIGVVVVAGLLVFFNSFDVMPKSSPVSGVVVEDSKSQSGFMEKSSVGSDQPSYISNMEITGDSGSSLSGDVEVVVQVWGKSTNSPVSNVNIFIDEDGSKCITNDQGICSFSTSPERHTFILKGDGIYQEEIKTVSESSSSFTFRVDRKLSVQVKVIDELTNDPLSDTIVYFDGTSRGKTSSTGILMVNDVTEGSHSVRVEYAGVSKDVTEQITSENNMIEIQIEAPKTVTISLKDTETGKTIDGATVFLESSFGSSTYTSIKPTDDTGKTQIENVVPGDYQIRLESVPGGFGTLRPSKLVNVGKSNTVEETVDMPNPKFRGSISCGTETPIGFDMRVDCVASLTNQNYERGITSQNTVGIVFVHTLQDDGSLVLTDSRLVDFGNVAPGNTPVIRDVTGLDTTFLKDDTISMVIFDGWKFTPENRENIGTVSISSSFAEQLLDDGISYCKQNTQNCVDIVVGVIKAVSPV